MNKTKAITKDILENTYTQRLLLRFLLGGLIALFITYLYLVGSTTFNILARKTLENTVRTLGSQVSQLELTYLNKTAEIDKNYALSKGFVDVHQSIFASRYITHIAIR